jgi:uncharacterized protein YcbK (DUF882 family)
MMRRRRGRPGRYAMAAWTACVAITWSAGCARAAPATEPHARAEIPEPTAARPTPAAQSDPSLRFFLSGDGEIAIQNAHSGERLRARYRDPGGRYRPETLAEIDRLFRSRGDDARTHVSLRLIETIDYLQDTERPRALLLLSGYRSGEYNAALIARGGRAARASMHTEGLAADLRFAGVDQRALWLRVRELDCCGAGFYASGEFLHVDVGRPRFWEEGTSRVGENLSRGNARLIARTDFDRYGRLDGAVVGLHAVTLRPLRIARAATFLPDGPGAESGAVSLRLASDGAAPAGDDDCLDFPAAKDPPPIVLTVAETSAGGARPAAATRGRIVLRTCAPQLESTPAEIATNPIEIRSALS